MGQANIPTNLINARVYNAGNVLLGQADVELSDLEYMTESITGLGIAGELDTPVLGHFKSITLKMKWNTVSRDALELMKPETHQLQIYGSMQTWNVDRGVYEPKGIRIACRSAPKKGGVGKFDAGKKMEPESEFELVYVKMSVAGEEVLEIDKFNMKCAINGVDYLAEVRSQLGM